MLNQELQLDRHATMRFRHTNRPGLLLGLIDFFTAGVFFLLYMPLGGLQDEIDEVLGHKTQRYWVAYALGIPTLFIYTLVWMARISEELKARAVELGVKGPTPRGGICLAGTCSGFCSLAQPWPRTGSLAR